MSQQEEIGNRIQCSRKAKGMSQGELARSIEKTLRTVQKYESGEIETSISTINTIAKVLGVSPAYLVGHDKEHIQLETLADVLQFFFQLDDISGISFEVKTKKRGQNGKVETAIVFKGSDQAAPLNISICQGLNQFQLKRLERDTYFNTDEGVKQWEDRYLASYHNVSLEKKEREVLTLEERIKRFQAITAMESAKKSDDN